MADEDPKNKKASLDKAPPAPPEFQVRKGLSGVVASRDAAQGDIGTMPGMGGPNAIGQTAMEVEQGIGKLAQLFHDPSPLADIVARLRAVVVQELQTAAAPPPAAGGGLAGIVAPPAPMAPPAMAGPGMPAPPPM